MTAAEVSFNRKIISEDLSNVEFDTSEDVEVIPTFDSMGLRDELLRGIYTYGKTIIIMYFLSYINYSLFLNNNILLF